MFRRIRDLREDNDLTQKQIGAKIGMSQSQYQKYESGIRTPPIDILTSLADIYNVSLDYLVERTNYKSVVHEDIMNARTKRLVAYYKRLSIEDQDYITGKMIELYKTSKLYNTRKRN